MFSFTPAVWSLCLLAGHKSARLLGRAMVVMVVMVMIAMIMDQTTT